MSLQQQSVRIGYAVSSKQAEVSITASLIDHAKQNNIDLIAIDISKPLLSQQPLDCIVHKLYHKEWTKQLSEFVANYPFVPIIDPPHHIERLCNRASMLDVVAQLKIRDENKGSFGIPKQVFLFDETELMGVKDLVKDMNFPIIAKPVVVDGSIESHKMYLVLNSEGLSVLSGPVVLQEFVNHGGVMFKVYVVGDHVECVKRKSLPDIFEGMFTEFECAVPFSLISNMAVRDGDGCGFDKVAIPPLEFVEELARELRRKLRLSLINFDLIRDANNENRYLLIDINYFPGFAKMPNYESVLIKFFEDVVHKGKSLKEEEKGGEGDNGDLK